MWSAANGNGASITAYVARETSGGNVGESVAAGPTATSVVLSGLAGAQAATFSVTAESSCGSGPPASSSAVTPSGAKTTYVTGVLADTPVAYYRLGDVGQSVMADSSGNQYDGAYAAGAIAGGDPAIPGDPSPSLISNPNVSCCNYLATAPGAGLPLYDQARSVEVWFQTSALANYTGLVSYGQSNTDQEFAVFVSGHSVGVDASNDQHYISLTHSYADGGWHMLAVTYSAGVATAYLDGQLQGTARFDNTLDTQPVTLGVGDAPGYNQFNGQLQDLAVYGSALTAKQVAAQFAASGYSVPAAPPAVHAATGGSNAATVSWGQPTAGNSTITGYIVRAVSASGAAGPAIAVDGDQTATRVYGLAAGTYTFRVVAVDGLGDSPASVTNPYTVTGASSTYVSTVLGASPSVFYRLGDQSTVAMTDSSPNQVDGSYVAGDVVVGQPAALASDPSSSVGDAQQQDGIGSVSSAVVPLYDSARSVEVWEKTTYSRYEGLVSWGQGQTDNAFALLMGPSSVSVDGYNDSHGVSTPYPIDDGVWHMVGLTFDGSTVTFYLDGVAIGTAKFNSTLDTLPGGLTIGDYSQSLYSADVADAAVFPSALSGAQMAAQFAAAGYGRPSAPGGVSAKAGANQATVSWSASSAPGSSVEGYVVTAVSGKVSGPSESVPASATSATVTGLVAGTAYSFKVTGIDSYGMGAAGVSSGSVTPTGASSTYVSTVLGASPSVFYRLGDQSTVAMTDSSPNQVDGSYVAGDVVVGQPAALASDPSSSVGDAQQQDGIGSVSSAVVPLYDSARSVEVWEKTTYSRYEGLVSWGQGQTDNAFALLMGPSSVSVDGYNDSHGVSTPYPIDDGVWHMVGLTFDGSTVTFYLDGVAIGTAKFNSTLDTLPGGLTIGDYSQSLYSADVADAAVFPSALSGAQMAAQFAAAGYGRPSAPGGVSAKAGANQATVSWSASSAPGSSVEGYVVTAVSGKVSGPSESVPASATSATVTGLVAGTAYSFKVTGIDSYGMGAAGVSSGSVTPTGASLTYVSTVLGASPSVFYRLGDQSTVAMTDSSPHQADGNYDLTSGSLQLGVAGPPVGDSATAASQNGGGNIGTAVPVLPVNNAARTIEGWFRTTGGGFQCLGGWGSTQTARGFDVCIDGSDVYVQGYGDDLGFVTPAAIDDGAWHFLAVTATGASATAYVDGTSIGTQSFVSQLDTAPGSTLFVGSYIGGGSSFSGDLADIAVFPSVLSPAQLARQFSVAAARQRQEQQKQHGAGATVSSLTVAGARREIQL